MKKFLKLLLFFQDQGFIHLKNKSIKKNLFSLLKIFFLKKQGKHIKIILLRDIIYHLLKYFYYFPAIILYVFNIRFASSDPNSIGTYSEELENIAINNKNFKLILLEPSTYTANSYLVKHFFKNEFIRIQNSFFCFFLIPFTYIRWITITPYDNENQICFQRQWYFNNEKKKNSDHHILFEGRLKSEEKRFFKNKKKFFSKKKIVYLHLREENNLILRNANFVNYIDTINFLIKKNYYVIFFGTKIPNYKNKNFKFYNLSKRKVKEFQMKIIPHTDLFIGQISGPFFLFNFYNIKMVITDVVIFNHLLTSKNIIVIFKKFYKEKNLMKLNNIYQEKIECLWDQQILKQKKIKVENNTNDEILEATKEILYSDFNYDNNNISLFNNDSKKYKNYYIRNSISKYFKDKTKINDFS